MQFKCVPCLLSSSLLKIPEIISHLRSGPHVENIKKFKQILK